ncbi:MAG TPA: hypothetical protein VNW72_09140 [Chthoniobacterales bacterium]|jgi:hypothetical protein|nr:hypothetical protein [Chthoniobacterales bacterium]
MSNSPRSADIESIDAIITAAYDVISGPVGKKRDWERERGLFWAGARLIPTARVPGRNDVDLATGRVRPTGGLAPLMLDVEGYIERVEPIFAKSGFYEKEVARRVEQFGRIAHVWSTYESRHDPNDPAPFMRGINSIQLFNDGSRWWILSIYWQHESPDHPIPEKYLERV